MTLSIDARIVAGSLFGLFGEKAGVTFLMQENRPTARCQAALDELVSAGDLTVEDANTLGGKTYRPTRTFKDEYLEVGRLAAEDPETTKFPITEPIR